MEDDEWTVKGKVTGVLMIARRRLALPWPGQSWMIQPGAIPFESISWSTSHPPRLSTGPCFLPAFHDSSVPLVPTSWFDRWRYTNNCVVKDDSCFSFPSLSLSSTTTDSWERGKKNKGRTRSGKSTEASGRHLFLLLPTSAFVFLARQFFSYFVVLERPPLKPNSIHVWDQYAHPLTIST